MKHLWKGASALVLLGAVVLMIQPGCVQAESPFFIEGVRAQSCDPVNVESTKVSFGTMDVAYQCGYWAHIVVGNQLVRRGDENKLQTETSRIEVFAFDVEVLDAAGDPLSTGGTTGAFTIPAAGFVDPANGTEPGYGIMTTLLVDGATAQFLYDQGGNQFIVARVTAHGRTLGGDEQTSAPFDFPISVCRGCLCFEPSDDSCSNATASPKEQCAIKQDQEFDCRFIGFSCSTEAKCGVPQ
jgi:hypothetical protein